jgi:hypothetical protein
VGADRSRYFMFNGGGILTYPCQRLAGEGMS